MTAAWPRCIYLADHVNCSHDLLCGLVYVSAVSWIRIETIYICKMSQRATSTRSEADDLPSA